MTVQEIQNKYHLAFSDLRFEEETHSYFLHGQRLPSVSSLIDNHYAKVDFTPMKKAIAIRENTSAEEIQSRWNKLRDDACEKGTDTHLYAEDYTGVEIPDSPTKISAKIFLDELPEYFEIAIREARMFSKLFRYAGTSDLILKDKRYNTLVIADYKTNKDLFKNYGQYMYAPFQDKIVCPYSKYELQLSYYQILLEDLGYKVSGRYIIHLLDADKCQSGTKPYLIYKTPDHTSELKELMK